MPSLGRQNTPQTPLQAALWACAGSLGLVFAYSCGYNLLLFAPSIYLLQIYDRVLSSRSADTLLMLTFIVALIVVVGGLLDALRRAALGRIGGWLEDRLRPAVLSACFDYALRADPARASEAYRDLTALRRFVESEACPMLFDVLWAPLFLGVLFLVHPLLGAIGAVSVLFLVGLALAGEFFTKGPLAQSGAALAKSYGRISMAVGNVHVIRAIGMLDGAARLVCQAAQAARSAHETAQRRNEIVMLIGKPIRALAPIERAIAGWKACATVFDVYRRLNDLLATVIPRASDDADAILLDKPEGRLNVDNVGVVLPGSDRWPLRGVSFRLAPGECLGIIGPSGSGKSTLGRIIAGISSPDAGRVLLDSIDVSVLRDSRGGRHVGYLPQEIDIIGDTVKEIIARLDHAEPQKVIEAAKLAGLHDAIMSFPQGYDTVVSNGVLRAFRQRLGLARALSGARAWSFSTSRTPFSTISANARSMRQ